MNKPRTIAFLLTSILTLIGYQILITATVPKEDIILKKYDQINWTRFKPKPIRVKKTQREPARTKKSEPERTAPGIQRIELDEILNAIEIEKIDLKNQSLSQAGKVRSAEKRQQESIALDLSSFANDLSLLSGDDSPLETPVIQNRGQGSGLISLETEAGESQGFGMSLFGDDAGADLRGPRSRGGRSGSLSISLKSLDDFGEGYDDFSEIYQPLIEWMRKNPAELPSVLKRFSDYTPGNLTSVVDFTIGGRAFIMYLLCVESTYEVRIALVEGVEVTYLIDQGFKKKNNLLRTGTVDYLEDGQIFKFGTNLQPAGARRAAEFYQIFLSWWENAKKELE